MDSQQIGIIGKHILIANLLAADLEVAEPIRDRGIDLIAFEDRAEDGVFKACPLQLKTASNARFDLDSKYKDFGNLRIVFVWNAREPAKAQLFVLTYDEAYKVLRKMKYDRSPTWQAKKNYAQTRPPKALRSELAQFEASTPNDLRKKLCI